MISFNVPIVRINFLDTTSGKLATFSEIRTFIYLFYLAGYRQLLGRKVNDCRKGKTPGCGFDYAPELQGSSSSEVKSFFRVLFVKAGR